MANFVHWATDIAVQTLYKDPARVAKRGARGAAIMRPVQELLQQHMQKVSAILADEISNDREEQDHRLLLQLVGDLFNAIKQHHVRVSDSDAGLQEILALGKETTFVRLGSNSPVNVRELYETMVVKFHLPIHQFLESAEVVIERQLMEQKHCMPLEYAIATLAPAISTLEPHLLQRLHVEQWAEWTERLGLGHIGELIVSRAKARLESLDLKLYAPISATPRGVYEGSPRRPSNTSEAPTCQLAEASRQDAEGKILEPITMFGEGWGFMSTMQNRRSSLSDTSSRTMRPGPGKATSISHSQRQARGPRSETSNIREKALSCPVLQGPNA